jgi:hypothetical protein
MKIQVGGGGIRLGSLLLLGLVGAALFALLNAKDIQRYFRLREM